MKSAIELLTAIRTLADQLSETSSDVNDLIPQGSSANVFGLMRDIQRELGTLKAFTISDLERLSFDRMDKFVGRLNLNLGEEKEIEEMYKRKLEAELVTLKVGHERLKEIKLIGGHHGRKLNFGIVSLMYFGYSARFNLIISRGGDITISSDQYSRLSVSLDNYQGQPLLEILKGGLRYLNDIIMGSMSDFLTKYYRQSFEYIPEGAGYNGRTYQVHKFINPGEANDYIEEAEIYKIKLGVLHTDPEGNIYVADINDLGSKK